MELLLNFITNSAPYISTIVRLLGCRESFCKIKQTKPEKKSRKVEKLCVLFVCWRWKVENVFLLFFLKRIFILAYMVLLWVIPFLLSILLYVYFSKIPQESTKQQIATQKQTTRHTNGTKLWNIIRNWPIIGMLCY